MLFAKRTFLCARRVPLRHVSSRASRRRRLRVARLRRSGPRARACAPVSRPHGRRRGRAFVPLAPPRRPRDGRLRSDRMDARRDASPRRFSPATLYVGGLNFATDEATLRDVCAAHGEVDSAKIIYDHDTGRSRGFAFVAFVREADARRAAHRLDGRNVDGRRVRCNLADERRRGGDRRRLRPTRVRRERPPRNARREDLRVGAPQTQATERRAAKTKTKTETKKTKKASGVARVAPG